MRLPSRFRLTIHGTIRDFLGRDGIDDQIVRLIRHILRGGEFSHDQLRSWGLTLSIDTLREFDADLEEDEMCNLYRVRSTADEVARAFNADLPTPFDWKADIYPRYVAPVIIARDGQRRLGPMKWGVPTKVQGKTKILERHVTNARNLDARMWRPGVAQPTLRCLVPFTQFAEPAPGKDEEGRPAQYWFTITPKPIACFAGFWQNTPDGPTFAFCTTEPNPLVAPLHPKAMPVILMETDEDRWLNGTDEDVRALQAPFPSQLMTLIT